MKRTALAVFAALMMSSSAKATVLISNLDAVLSGPNGSQLNSAAPGFYGPYGSKAAGFTVGATPYKLDSVRLALQIPFPASVPLLRIYGGTTAGPVGQALTSFVTPALSLGDSIYTFAPSADFMLEAATTYFLVLTNEATVNDAFAWRSTNTVASGPGATAAPYYFSFGAAPPSGPTANMTRYEVSGSLVLPAVPEPATWGMFIIGFGLIGSVIRRRKVYVSFA